MKIETLGRTEPALTAAPLATSQIATSQHASLQGLESAEPTSVPTRCLTHTSLLCTLPRNSTAQQLEVSTAQVLELLEHQSAFEDSDRAGNADGPTQICHPNGHALESILHNSVYAAVRRVQVRCDRNVVVLRGRVPCFFQKQIVLSVTMKHAPGAQIVDFIRVDYH